MRSTRVTFMMAREVSNRGYPEIGVPTPITTRLTIRTIP
jgi:hypothetical protein